MTNELDKLNYYIVSIKHTLSAQIKMYKICSAHGLEAIKTYYRLGANQGLFHCWTVEQRNELMPDSFADLCNYWILLDKNFKEVDLQEEFILALAGIKS